MVLPGRSNSYAVLLGASTYESSELPDLRAVLSNLTDLYRLLTDPTWGVLPVERCVVVPDPTDLRQLYKTVRKYALEAVDTLLVYFAGHGIAGATTDELYLSLCTTDLDALPVTALPFDMLRQLCLESPAARKVIVLDCCFSGRALATVDHATLGNLDVNGTYVVTSATATEVSFAPPDAPHTALTGELISLLRNGIAAGPELLNLRTIYEHLRASMRARGLPLPHQCGSDTADQLALGRNPAHDVAADERFAGPRGVSRTERIELTLLCKNLPSTTVFDMYRRAVGPWGPALEPAVAGAGAVIDRLAQLLVAPDDVPPVFQFAVWAARLSPAGDLRERLDGWVDKVAGRLGLGVENVALLRELVREQAELQPQRHFVVVRLDPSPVLDDHYGLSVRLYRGADGGEPQACGDEDRPLRVEQIRERLGELLPSLVRAVDGDRVTVEFLVPRELINVGFDQWLVASRDRLGVLYTVVVCDLDRPNRAAPDTPWRSKWRLLQDAVTPNGCRGVYWVDPDGNREPGALRAGLLRRAEENWVCLALESPPAPGAVATMLGDGLDLGAPVAFWPRNPPNGTGPDRSVRDILSATALATLPARVLDLRREAVELGLDEHCGHRLSLLWDDPERMPAPGHVLGAPQSSPTRGLST